MDIKSLFALSQNRPDETILIIQDSKKFFEEKIHGTIINNCILTDQLISCGNYTALILSEAVHNIPASWIATDFIIKARHSKNPMVLLEGAKMCFLLCSLFKGGRLARRLDPGFYINMGINLFYESHSQTRLEISFLMATHYDTMVDVVNKTFHLKKPAGI